MSAMAVRRRKAPVLNVGLLERLERLADEIIEEAERQEEEGEDRDD